MKIIKVTTKLRNEYRKAIADLENIAVYPLGSDFFKLDHGKDYFAFFDRLGELHYYAAIDKGEVVAVGAGIIRHIPQKVWYLCDLKVRPDYRGEHIPLKMLSRAFLPCYLRCRRGYAISMNPSDGSPNRIAKMLARFKWTPFSVAGELVFFSLSYDEAMRFRDVIKEYKSENRGEITYLSLNGKKNLVLQSTGHSMKLLHMQFGYCKDVSDQSLKEPLEGHVHMICTKKTGDLDMRLETVGIKTSASATIIEHGMKDWNWDFVLTSDI